MSFAKEALALIRGVEVVPIEASRCEVDGNFGYGKDTADISLKVAKQSLFPTIRSAEPDCLISAKVLSCRHQIASGPGSTASHVA